MAYHLQQSERGMFYVLGTFDTLAEAVAAAPRSGQPTKTGRVSGFSCRSRRLP